MTEKPKNGIYGNLSLLFSYPEVIPDEDLLKNSLLQGKLPGIHDLIDLQNQYVRLFINALPEVPCPPYGSFYLEGSCMGESTVRVRNIYRKYGFETDELPDHIAVELEFLKYLEQYFHVDEEARSDFLFLINHLISWTPAFFKEIEKHDGSGFYIAVSRAAEKIINKAISETSWFGSC